MVVYTLEQRWAKWACDKQEKIILIFAGMQSKLSHLAYRKPARIHWKADALKTSHRLVWILAQRQNWAIFLRKLAGRCRYSQWRSLSGHVEGIFVHKNWSGEYKQHIGIGYWFRGIIGQFSFENEQREAVTVDRYWAILNDFLFTKI